MKNYFSYMRISTKEERGLQKFTRQEQALSRYAIENNIEFTISFRDDASGKSFDRPEWKKLESIAQAGDTIVFKDLCRFTREYDNGFSKYMEMLNKGVDLIFIDNPTISTTYIKQMMDVAEKQSNRIAKKSLKDTIELLLLVELDRAEQERLLISKRIQDGMTASGKRAGRPMGKLDKISDDLVEDIKLYLSDRSIQQTTLMKKYNISRNTLVKYINLYKNGNIA